MKLTRSKLKELIEEAASEYVWGVKAPGRVANQYSLRTFRTTKRELRTIIKEELIKLYEQSELLEEPDWGAWNPQTDPAFESLVGEHFLRDEFDDGRLGEASLQSATNRARQGLSRSGDVITDNSGQIWQLRRDRSRDVARGDYYWHQLQYTPEYSNVSGRQGIQQWRWASPGETGTQPAYVVPNLLQYYEEEPGVGYYIDREDPTPASTREWADRIGLD